MEPCAALAATLVTAPGAPLITWSRAFPGTPERVGQARRFLATILAGSPLADDALLCLSELASNAILHSASGRPGGQFGVRVSAAARRLRVEIEDQGGPWAGAPSRPAAPTLAGPGEHRGRGLAIVGALASDWGIAGDAGQGRTVWFELALPVPAPA